MKLTHTIAGAVLVGLCAFGAYAMRPTARLERTAKAAVLAKLKDPGSATFGRFHVIATPPGDGAICGSVNAKNGFGGLTGATPFVVLEGRAFFNSERATMSKDDAEAIGYILDRCAAEMAE